MLIREAASRAWKHFVMELFEHRGDQHLLRVDYCTSFIQEIQLSNSLVSKEMNHNRTALANNIYDKVVSENRTH